MHTLSVRHRNGRSLGRGRYPTMLIRDQDRIQIFVYSAGNGCPFNMDGESFVYAMRWPGKT